MSSRPFVRPAALAALLAAFVVPPHAARAQARPASDAAAAFSPAGRYALVLSGSNGPVPFSVPFTIVVSDSGGRWGGQFIGQGGRPRPLIAVVPRAAASELVVQYADGSGFATMLLRVQGDSVRGATEYSDGTFTITGTRAPAARPAPR